MVIITNNCLDPSLSENLRDDNGPNFRRMRVPGKDPARMSTLMQVCAEPEVSVVGKTVKQLGRKSNSLLGLGGLGSMEEGIIEEEEGLEEEEAAGVPEEAIRARAEFEEGFESIEEGEGGEGVMLQGLSAAPPMQDIDSMLLKIDSTLLKID